MKILRPIALVLLTMLLTPSTTVLADAVVSDGSLGAFNPIGSQVIDLDSVAPDGVLNYTTINIPAGVTIRFDANASNTPVFMAATGLVVIDGIVDVSAGHFSTAAGLAGGPGGSAGSGAGGRRRIDHRADPCVLPAHRSSCSVGDIGRHSARWSLRSSSGVGVPPERPHRP